MNFYKDKILYEVKERLKNLIDNIGVYCKADLINELKEIYKLIDNKTNFKRNCK